MRGEGGKKWQKSSDVLYGRPPRPFGKLAHLRAGRHLLESPKARNSKIGPEQHHTDSFNGFSKWGKLEIISKIVDNLFD